MCSVIIVFTLTTIPDPQLMSLSIQIINEPDLRKHVMEQMDLQYKEQKMFDTNDLKKSQCSMGDSPPFFRLM